MAQLLHQSRIATRPDVVWQALRDPAILANWFGWDADTLAEEIRFIFIDNATETQPGRQLSFGEWEGVAYAFELVPEGEATLLRVMQRGGPGPGAFDEIAEGWISFVEQLRHMLERHRGEERRTLHFGGKSGQPRLALADEIQARERWHASPHQTGVLVPEWGDGLLVVMDEPEGGGSATLTTFGLDEGAFAALREHWERRWAALQ